MVNNNDPVDSHLQNAVFGVPLLRPDEQHRCLGTFLERIDLKITFEQALTRDFTPELTAEIKRHPDFYLLIHGKMDGDILGRYVRLANRTNTRFAIKTSRYYHHDRDCAAVILCADHAIAVDQIDIGHRFPIVDKDAHQKQQSWFSKLFRPRQ